jgi:uncharacterized heparinase superfamily protein
MREVAMTSNSYLFPAVFPAAGRTVLPGFAAPAVAPSLGRYWRTLKHLRLSQFVYLALHRTLGKNDISRWPGVPVGLRARGVLRHMAEWQPELARQVIQAGDVRFVGPSAQTTQETPWYLKEVSRRQIFHANYCDFLNVELTSSDDVNLLRQAICIALSWCDQNSTGQELAWQPFSLSLRIVNWLKFLVRNWIRAQELGYGEQVDQMLSSLRIQVLSLESRLERELLANHLLKNAKALVFAGALLEAPESPRWRSLGQRLLKEQIAEQILSDGGHIERSPMYHAWVLDDLLDTQQLFELCTPDDLQCMSAVSSGIARMARYLGAIVHPDGEIPLLNDSQLDVTRSTGKILSDAGAPEWMGPPCGIELRILADTGYATIRDRDSRSFLIFDCGPLGPDYQPGHGHSDVLTYELTLCGQRVVVDTGVSSYEPGPERQYERSTAAHNTIRVDGVDQAEVWGSFRVGARPTVSPIARGEIVGGHFVRGQHFGYKRFHVNHARAIGRLADNSWIFADVLQGKGRHRVESFIHFHPSVQVSPHRDDLPAFSGSMIPRWNLQFGGIDYVLMTRGGGKFALTSAWYSPGFAIRSPQSVIHWTHEGALPITMVYAIVPAGTAAISLDQAADQLTAKLNENTRMLPTDESTRSNVGTIPNGVSNSSS